MEDAKGQVSGSSAEIYERFFVPALFSLWTGRLIERAAISGTSRVLDVACGTGVLARSVVERWPSARVHGLDRNMGMLSVAREQTTAVDWVEGRAEGLPFDDGCLDAVLSQFGLMFFDDRAQALREMWRVLAPGGRLVVAVWDQLDHSPGYRRMTALLDRLFGREIARELEAPYVLGDIDALRRPFEEAGVGDVTITTLDGTAQFPSIDAWVHVDIRGWTLAERLDEGQFEQLLAVARNELRPFAQADGSVRFRHDAHLVCATKS